MKKNSSFGIGKKLYAVALSLSAVLVGVGLYAYIHLYSVVELAERAREIRVPQLQRVAAMELNVTRVSLQLRHAMLSRTPDELASTLADVVIKRSLIDTAVANYDKAMSTPQGRALFAKVPPMLSKFWEIGGANIKLIQDGRKSEAFVFLVDKTIPARNELLTALKENVDFQEARLNDEIQSLATQAQQTLYVLLASILAAIAGLLLFSWYVADLLRRRVAVSCAVAERVRDGDLSATVDDAAHDEFTPLLAALQDMQLSLTRVVAKVRVNAESVSLASSEIAGGNMDLSQRTELQASALQQTSATMDELGATVSNNADNAHQARSLAEGASAVAAKGGVVVAQVITTMRDINSSSKQINDIISLIDGIAFQTNILSLNAAVEAARAGEQGRGFAVVAAEVRSLAQRSAEAARQIKTLITSSVARVEQGSALVSEAGQTMGEIVSAIQRVTDIVGEISSASAEQSSGVRQVGDAINQMDKATQQNAALVEQSAAAAEGLKERARELVHSVAVFKLR